MDRDGVRFVRNDQCEAGMTTVVNGQVLPARKTTGWITNSEEIAKELEEFFCRNRLAIDDSQKHVHGELVCSTLNMARRIGACAWWICVPDAKYARRIGVCVWLIRKALRADVRVHLCSLPLRGNLGQVLMFEVCVKQRGTSIRRMADLRARETIRCGTWG